jgi:cytochrome c oxidase subunit II
MTARRILTATATVAVALVLAACGGDDEGGGGGDSGGGGGGGGGATQASSPGAQVFSDQACGSCHTLAAADTNGTTGPNLDEALPGMSAAEIRESIVDPNAKVEEGYSEGIMPGDFGDKLSEQQLTDLVDFLRESAGR